MMKVLTSLLLVLTTCFKWIKKGNKPVYCICGRNLNSSHFFNVAKTEKTFY